MKKTIPSASCLSRFLCSVHHHNILNTFALTGSTRTTGMSVVSMPF